MQSVSPLRALGLVRVSTEDQAREGVSLDAQARAVTERAAERGYELELLTEAGVGGASDSRPAITRLLAEMEAGAVQVVLFHEQSRLTRDLETWGKLTKLAKRRGIRLESVTDSIDYNTRHGRLVSGIRAVVDADRLEEISAHVRKGMTEKRLRGEWYVKAPFGYRWEWQTDAKGREFRAIVPDDATAPLVAQAFSWIAKDHLPLREAWRRIRALSPNAWTGPGGLRHALRNAVYIGMVRGKDGELLPGLHEPLVERKLWDSVQAILAARSHSKGRKRGQTHLLTGILRCPACGGRMTTHSQSYGRAKQGQAKRKVYHGYRCQRNRIAGDCSPKIVSGLLIEPALIEALKDLPKAPSGYLRYADDPQDARSRAAVQKRIEGITDKEAKLALAFAGGDISRQVWERAKARLREEEAALRQQLASLPLEGRRAATKRLAGLAYLLESDLSPEVKRDALLTAVAEVHFVRKGRREFDFELRLRAS